MLGISALLPEENDIVKARADQCEDDEPDGNVPVQIRILPRALRHMCRHQNAAQHRNGHHDAIHCDREITDCNCFGDIVEINSKVREGNVHFSHDIRHKEEPLSQKWSAFPEVFLLRKPPVKTHSPGIAVFNFRSVFYLLVLCLLLLICFICSLFTCLNIIA